MRSTGYDDIFEPFFTTKDVTTKDVTTKDVGEGTGLGLDVVDRIVSRQHWGDVTAESAPGRTEFTVQLPLVFAAMPAGVPGAQ